MVRTCNHPYLDLVFIVMFSLIPELRGQNPAELPADAKLTFDGQATESTSANRLFTTPPLVLRGWPRDC
jgi:hypothetical protein